MPRGGARPGAGRPPKAIRFCHEVAAAEQTIVSALPELLKLLLEAARGGDVSAAKYLVDRAMGRTALQSRPLAEDYTLATDHPAAEAVGTIRRRRELGKALVKPPNVSREVEVFEHMVAEEEACAEMGMTREEAAEEQAKRYEDTGIQPPPPPPGAPIWWRHRAA